MCNPLFKERILCEWADRTDCTWIATGHYCQLEDRNGYRYILTGDDPTKDQSYFLWKLPQEILRRMLFPLGGMTKQEVRAYLAEKGFEAKARGGESMEICFIDKDYRDFLREHCPDIDERIGRDGLLTARDSNWDSTKDSPITPSDNGGDWILHWANLLTYSRSIRPRIQ